ncbi:MAG: methylmalonyl-CoA decarboxylase [Candidatus Parcubacteria bacterium]|nr:methylmalonyl-CoA decarboxylase [Candidatus Parcubacteria bacterium]
MSLIETEINGFIGTLLLNRPDKLNALSHSFVAEIILALDDFTNKKVRAVILKSNVGEKKIWSVGHDVSELPKGGRDPLGHDDSLCQLSRKITEVPYPIIALVNGSVWGGACEVVFACSMIVASENATFAFTPAKMSVPYNMAGLINFMGDTGLHLFKEMICTAQPIPASRFERAGIINYVVPEADLQKKVDELAGHVANNSPLAITAMLAELNMMAGAKSISPVDWERMQGLRRRTYDSADYKEALDAFLSRPRRTPVFKGE